MTDPLETPFRALRAEPPGPGYDRIEAGVMRGIAELRRERQAAPALLAVRLAGFAVALSLGVTGGATASAMAGRKPEVAVFSVHTGLAPSTLLDRHG